LATIKKDSLHDKRYLKNNLTPLDEYIYGTGDLTGLIDKKFGEYRFGISIGKKLDNRIIDTIVNGPTLEYYEYRVVLQTAALYNRIL